MMKRKHKVQLFTRAALMASALGLSVMAQAQDTPPVETDARLHSDGNGWKLDQAKIIDKSLPRVLLIGDSILGGYQKYALLGLKDKAYVDAWVQPYNQGHMQGNYFIKMLDEVLAKGPYDAIAFNMGLHGFQKGRIPEGQFIPLTKKLVTALREKAPGAKLIWLSTTPITEQDTRPEFWKLGPPEKALGLDAESNPIIIEHNRMAAEVMDSEKVPVLDLYALVMPHLDWVRGDMFHWKDPAYQLMGKAIAETLQPTLSQNPKPN